MKVRIVNYFVYDTSLVEAGGGQFTDKALCPNTKKPELTVVALKEVGVVLFCAALHFL